MRLKKELALLISEIVSRLTTVTHIRNVPVWMKIGLIDMEVSEMISVTIMIGVIDHYVCTSDGTLS